MLSNCAISRLYMRVLKTDMRKIDFCKFFSFLLFQCGASGRSLLASERISRSDDTLLEFGREWSPIVWTLAVTSGRTVSNTVRTRTTCLLVPNAARVRTTLMHRSDRDPIEAI
jgi:hypothetical protein